MTDDNSALKARAVLRRLSPGDVLMLLRVSFWIATGGCTPYFAVRQVAIIAFMVFARVSAASLAGLRLRHYRPDGEDVVVVTSRGKTRTIPLPPAVKMMVERYLISRPTSDSDHLFLTWSGKPLERSSYNLTLRRTAKYLGLTRDLRGMLHRFCAETLDADHDDVAVANFFGRNFANYVAPAPVTIAKMRQMIARHDRFDGTLLRCIGNDDFAMATAQRLGTVMPSVFWTVTKDNQERPRLTAEEHPMVEALLAVDWARNRFARNRLRAELLDRHLADLEELLGSQKLTHRQAAQLFGVKYPSFWRLLKHARTGPGWQDRYSAEVNPPRPKTRRTRTTEEDRRALAELKAVEWPADAAQRDQLRNQLIRRYFPHVADMLNARKLDGYDACKLFKLQTLGQISRLRLVFGSPDPRPGKRAAKQREHVLAHQLVRRELDNGPAGETRPQLFERLKRDHDFRHGFSEMRLFIQYPFENRMPP